MENNQSWFDTPSRIYYITAIAKLNSLSLPGLVSSRPLIIRPHPMLSKPNPTMAAGHYMFSLCSVGQAYQPK